MKYNNINCNNVKQQQQQIQLTKNNINARARVNTVYIYNIMKTVVIKILIFFSNCTFKRKLRILLSGHYVFLLVLMSSSSFYCVFLSTCIRFFTMRANGLSIFYLFFFSWPRACRLSSQIIFYTFYVHSDSTAHQPMCPNTAL